MSKLNTFGSIHPAVLMTYFVSVIVVSMFATNPIILLIALCGGVSFFGIMKTPKELLIDLGFYIPMLLLITLINPVFSHNGVTPLFFMNGNPVTLEAILYGGNIAIMLVAIIYWCKCYSMIMTTDKFLFLFGKAMPKLALVLSMAMRFIPFFKNKLKEIRGVQSSLGLYEKKGFVNKGSGELKVFSALTTWAMENSIDTAASMNARGYGLKGRSHFSIYKFRRRDFCYLLAVLMCFGVVMAGISMNLIDFSFYPEISELKYGFKEISVYIAFGVLSFIPFLSELWEVIVWKYSVSKI